MRFIGYGVYIDGHYQSVASLPEGKDFIDSSVALGLAQEASLIGWYNQQDSCILYTHEDVICSK